MKSFLFMLVAAMFSLAAWAAPPPTEARMPNGTNDDAMQCENVDQSDVVGVAHVSEIESVDNLRATNDVMINGRSTQPDVGVSRGDCPIVIGLASGDRQQSPCPPCQYQAATRHSHPALSACPSRACTGPLSPTLAAHS